MSVQYFAVASQKLTWPVVSAAVPVFTDAVRVTTLPEETVVTGPALDVTVRFVTVSVFV